MLACVTSATADSVHYCRTSKLPCSACPSQYIKFESRLCNRLLLNVELQVVENIETA